MLGVAERNSIISKELAMRIITADETGLVKVVRLESGECLAVSAGEQSRARSARAICHNKAAATGNTSPTHDAGCFGSVHVARLAGAVETWDILEVKRAGTSGNACALSLRGTVVDCPVGPVALSCLPPAPGSREHSRVLTCNAEGEVQVSFAACGDKDDLPQPVKFSIRGPISAAIVTGTGVAGSASLVAGGRENDLKTWDVNTAQCTWKAKNVAHDFLDMRQPVWISSICSLVPETEGGGSGGRQQLVAGTAHRQVRLYDVRAQKRPTHSVDADEHGITTMAVGPDGREVVVADTAGLVRVLDLRKMKWGRRFEGPAGSVRGVAFHPTLPVLACVGLDRMARVYDYRSTEQKFQVYLKQRLNDVVFDGEGEVCVGAGTAEPEARSKRGRDSGNIAGDWSGSDGWGSGEEYEMDDGDSSSEEEEEEGLRDVNGSIIAGVSANGHSRMAVDKDSESDSGDGESEEGESSEGGDGSSDGEEDSGSSSEDVDDGENSSESEEERGDGAQVSPPKRQNVQKSAHFAKKRRR